MKMRLKLRRAFVLGSATSLMSQTVFFSSAGAAEFQLTPQNLCAQILTNLDHAPVKKIQAEAENQRLIEEGARKIHEAELVRIAEQKILANEIRERLYEEERSQKIDLKHTALADILVEKEIKRLIRSGAETVFLAVGSSTTQLSSKDAELLRTVVTDLIADEHLVFYDADSALGTFVRDVSQGKAIGISGRHSSVQDRVLGLTNPFRRMNVLLEMKKVILTPDSALGVGLLIEGQSENPGLFRVFDPNRQWPQADLAAWSKTLRKEKKSSDQTPMTETSSVSSALSEPTPGLMGSLRKWFGSKVADAKLESAPEFERTLSPALRGPKNLGIQYDSVRSLEPITTANELRASLRSGWLSAKAAASLPFLGSFDEMIQKTSDSELIRADQYSSAYVVAIQKSRYDSTLHNLPIPGGSVVLGSSKGDPYYEKFIYDTTFALGELGIPVTTGGAGGFMATANEAATQAHVYSIGIPRGGLPTERSVPTQIQDITIRVPDYEMRIPVLLDHREWIRVAPGGSGTMKELAVHLVNVQATGQAPLLTLEGQLYYAGLASFLKALPLTSDLIQSIHLIDSKDEALQLAADYMRQYPDRTANLISNVKMPARPKVRISLSDPASILGPAAKNANGDDER